MAGKFDSTLDALIKDQTGFITGLGEIPGISGGASPSLNPAFTPTLTGALETGFRADTGAARQAATAASDLTLKNTLAAIAEQSSAKGLTGSSAQSQQGLTAGVDLATLLGDRLAQLELGADEAAAGRRVGALGSALGEGDFLANIFGKENQFALGKGNLDLATLLGQSGAGQDLISSLLRNNPLIGGDTSGFGNTLLGGGPTGGPVGVGFGSDKSGLAPVGFGGPLLNKDIGTSGLFGVSNVGTNRDTAAINAQAMERNELLASIFGPSGGAAVKGAGIGIFG